MHIIEAKLFGVPELHFDGTLMELPFKQAEALLFYLCTEGKANKAILADMIWGDRTDCVKVASNFRNAIYVIRRSIGKDFFKNAKADVLTFGTDYRLVSDAYDLTHHPKADSFFRTEDFLSGFYLKNNDQFNDWVEKQRQYYKNLSAMRLHDRINELVAQNKYDDCRYLCETLIHLDEYDETAYRTLIELFHRRKEYSTALGIYAHLEKLLRDELFDEPNSELQSMREKLRRDRTRELSQFMLNWDNADQNDASSIFFGREAEIAQLHRFYSSFQNGRKTCSVLISGEIGIGKTRLLQQSLSYFKTGESIIICTNCYPAEKDYILKPWQRITQLLIEQLRLRGLNSEYDEFIHAALAVFPFLKNEYPGLKVENSPAAGSKMRIQDYMLSALVHLSHRVKLVFCIDDIQWADDASLFFVHDIQTFCEDNGIMFAMTMRNNLEYQTRPLLMELSASTENVQLEPFSYDETIAMAGQLLEGFPLSDKLKAQLYSETNGNAFFIHEIANNIRFNGSVEDVTPNMQKVIGQRINSLTKEARQILCLISLFYDGAFFDMLMEIFNKDELKLIELLEQLIQRNIIYEQHDGDNIRFHICHQKVHKYVYNSMSFAKRRILHNKIGICYEKQLKGNEADTAIYSKLIYHFERGSSPEKFLQYSIKYLGVYLNTVDEFFPTLANGKTIIHVEDDVGAEPWVSDLGGVEELLHNVAGKINDAITEDVDGAAPDDESIKLLSEFDHMMGRYYICRSEYELGLLYIERLRKRNAACATPQMQANIIMANRQLMCLYINHYMPSQMISIIDESFSILGDASLLEEKAIWMRMLGYNYIMRGEIPFALSELQQAASIFEQSPVKNKYMFNLAACYAWLGEAMRLSENYPAAMKYYADALNTCNQFCSNGGISIFHTYAGMAAYDCGMRETAKTHLETAVSIYSGTKLMWGRALAYCYLSQYYVDEGRCRDVLPLLKEAIFSAEKLESQYEKGVVMRVCAQMRSRFKDNSDISDALSELLTHSTEYYLHAACDCLENVFSPLDKSYLATVKASM